VQIISRISDDAHTTTLTDKPKASTSCRQTKCRCECKIFCEVSDKNKLDYATARIHIRQSENAKIFFTKHAFVLNSTTQRLASL